jgi:hypothetical protein
MAKRAKVQPAKAPAAALTVEELLLTDAEMAENQYPLVAELGSPELAGFVATPAAVPSSGPFGSRARMFGMVRYISMCNIRALRPTAPRGQLR